MSDLVGNPEDQFSGVVAHTVPVVSLGSSSGIESFKTFWPQL